jgi:hypothetical protein
MIIKPTTIKIIELTLSALTLLAVVAGGGWAFYLYHLSGSNEWTTNITLETQVLPYHGDLRLLVVHVKTKNPRPFQIELNAKDGDSYELGIRKIPADAPEETALGEDSGSVIKNLNLMAGVDVYQLFPSAEMDDMRMVVLPVNTTVALTAAMRIHNGETDKSGKPDTDFITASTVVHIDNK